MKFDIWNFDKILHFLILLKSYEVTDTLYEEMWVLLS